MSTKIGSRSVQLLGYCKCLCQVHPDLATVPEPLSRLTRKDVPYQWGKEHRGKAFNELKKRQANTETGLGDFDKDAETRLITDASPVGLGDKDAERFCKYPPCQMVSMPPPPEPLKRTELPSGPWQYVSADLMTP